jgi:putative sterol carrier protein
MAIPFPSAEWLEALIAVLNSDERYAKVAKSWEGAIFIIIDPDESSGGDGKEFGIYLDLWHGTCRGGEYFEVLPENFPDVAFTLRTGNANMRKILRGDLDPMQAMLTRRLRVDGNMGYMLRNVPTVLDFVRCCRLVPMDTI